MRMEKIVMSCLPILLIKNIILTFWILGVEVAFCLDLCNQRFGSELILSGVDMNDSELKLARNRLAHTNTKLYQGAAQNLDCFADSSFDVIFCHWALTLMDPVVDVLATSKRLLKESGIFAAIIDGNLKAARLAIFKSTILFTNTCNVSIRIMEFLNLVTHV